MGLSGKGKSQGENCLVTHDETVCNIFVGCLI